MKDDPKLISMAKSSDPQIFAESVFPKAFGTTAQDSYMESQETYTSLFEDRAKYNAIMHALGAILYREMRGRGGRELKIKENREEAFHENL